MDLRNWYDNLPPKGQKVFIGVVIAFGIFWVGMIINTVNGGIDAQEKADAARARVEGVMNAERAIDNARQSHGLPR